MYDVLTVAEYDPMFESLESTIAMNRAFVFGVAAALYFCADICDEKVDEAKSWPIFRNHTTTHFVSVAEIKDQWSFGLLISIFQVVLF